MEQAIELDNEAIAQNNTAYWENLTDQVKLRDGFIRDQEYLMAYALYQFSYREPPIYATGQALIQQEITEEQLYSQLNAWTLADQLVYPALDFVGLIPGVDIGADLVGFFYAQLRGDMQQIPLYAMALMIPPGFDNIAHYGGRGTSRMVAVYTENGITYVPKLANEPIDEAVEAVRASVLTHDPVIAQAIIDADAPYVFHEADELYKKRHSAIYPGTGNDLAKAKLITGEIADHCPLLLANPQLVTRELSEVLAGMPDATKRKAFLEALDGFGDIEKLTTFVDDLANAPELVVALKGRWELVRAWEVAFSDPNSRIVTGNLENISNHLSRNVHTADELKVAFDAASDKAKWIDDIGLGIVRKPNRHAEFVNSSGNLLKWQEEANVPAKATNILNDPNAPASARLEADVAQYIHQNKPPITGLSIKVRRANNSQAGDLDVYTDTHLLEVKTGSGSVNYSQFDKYVNPGHPEYLNPYGKSVVLYIENPMTPSVRATVESNLPTGVSVANSRVELLSLLE